MLTFWISTSENRKQVNIWLWMFVLLCSVPSLTRVILVLRAESFSREVGTALGSLAAGSGRKAGWGDASGKQSGPNWKRLMCIHLNKKRWGGARIPLLAHLGFHLGKLPPTYVTRQAWTCWVGFDLASGHTTLGQTVILQGLLPDW